MQISTIVLRGPGLFADLLNKNPKKFDAAGILKLQSETAAIMRQRIADIGGPQIKPIIAEALNKKAFGAKYAELTGNNINGIDLDAWQSFGTYEIKDSLLKWRIFFNIDALRFSSSSEQQPVGAIFVHEFSGMLYGEWIETKNKQKSPLCDGIHCGNPEGYSVQEAELSKFMEGWACYFSGIPFSISTLLNFEVNAANTRLYNALPLQLRAGLYSQLTNRHFFGALALLKIEMAFGFQSLVNLMHNPPIVTNNFDNNLQITQTLWREYCRANTVLQQNSLPLKFVHQETSFVPRV